MAPPDFPPSTLFHHNTPFSLHLPTLPSGPQAHLAPPYLPALPSARPTWPQSKTPPPPPGRPRPLPPPHRPAARAKPGSRSHTPARVPAPRSSGQEVAPLRGVGNTARPSPRPGFGPESGRGGWGERAPLPSPPAPARSAPPSPRTRGEASLTRSWRAAPPPPTPRGTLAARGGGGGGGSARPGPAAVAAAAPPHHHLPGARTKHHRHLREAQRAQRLHSHFRHGCRQEIHGAEESGFPSAGAL